MSTCTQGQTSVGKCRTTRCKFKVELYTVQYKRLQYNLGGRAVAISKQTNHDYLENQKPEAPELLGDVGQLGGVHEVVRNVKLREVGQAVT